MNKHPKGLNQNTYLVHMECICSILDLKVHLKVTVQGWAKTNVMLGAFPRIEIHGGEPLVTW